MATARMTSGLGPEARPAIGDHEYDTSSPATYFDYFGKAAGPRNKGWYSYDVGAWHVVVLNGNCDKVACARGSEQGRWLRADLAAHKNKCTLAYWHQSRFASDAVHGDNVWTRPFWQALYDNGADLVVSAHAHTYERFAPRPRRERPTQPGGSARSWSAPAGGTST